MDRSTLCLPPGCHRQAPAAIHGVTLILAPTEPILPLLRKSLEPSLSDPASSLQSHVEALWGSRGSPEASIPAMVSAVGSKS